VSKINRKKEIDYRSNSFIYIK